MAEAPSFIERDGGAIETALIAEWEALSGKPLYPAQVERLLISLIAYREQLVKIGIQYAAEQNLVDFAVEDKLDALGRLTQTSRLEPQKSRCTIRFSRAIATASVLIAAGTRVQDQAGRVTFATLSAVTLTIGVETIEVVAEATEEGFFADGFEAGSLNTMPAPLAGISAANATTSNGGSDLEGDDRYRTRIQLAPNKYSASGTDGVYEFGALSADPSIVDVAVLSPARVRVKIYVLTKTGLPSSEILGKVLAAINDQKLRSLTDDLEVLAPTEIQYQIAANVTLLSTADGGSLAPLLLAAAQGYAQERRDKLGADVVKSQITSVLSLAGVYKVELTSPASDLAIAPSEWANATSVQVNLVGLADG